MLELDMTKEFVEVYGSRSHDKHGAVNYPEEIFTGENLSDITTEMEDNKFQILGQRDVIDNRMWLFIEVSDEDDISDSDVANLELQLLVTPKTMNGSSMADKQFSLGVLDVPQPSTIITVDSFPIGEFQLIVSEDDNKDYQMSAWVSISE